MIRVDDVVPPGSMTWWVFAGVVLFGRACDLGSTYAGTPRLVLEGNPIAKRLGWKWGIPLNILLSLFVAALPMLSISLATSSVLVAARNLQSVWLMRTLGEMHYRQWMSERVRETRTLTLLGCFWGESGLTILVGIPLVVFSSWELVPFGIGCGLVVYGLLVGFFTTLGVLRRRN